MNKLDLDYQNLLKDILGNGTQKETRNGGTLSVFGRQIRHKMSDGFPALTTKKLAFKTMTTELLWFLRGDTNIKYLVDNNCNIWDGDAYKNYVLNMSHMEIQDVLRNDNLMTKEEFINKIKTDDEFAKKWGELGPIYGKQWRNWKTNSISIDQIQNLINELKTNPDSRRLMVNAWNVGELDQMALPPCHFSWQCYSHEQDGKRYLSLAWNQRSVDTFLGLPFNIASYGLLLEIIAKEVNMVPDELIGNLGDTHLYLNHIEQAKEQISREPMKLTKLLFKDHLNEFDSIIDILRVNDFVLDDYHSHPAIKAPLSN
jgi:thymidylate synthase